MNKAEKTERPKQITLCAEWMMTSLWLWISVAVPEMENGLGKEECEWKTVVESWEWWSYKMVQHGNNNRMWLLPMLNKLVRFQWKIGHMRVCGWRGKWLLIFFFVFIMEFSCHFKWKGKEKNEAFSVWVENPGADTHSYKNHTKKMCNLFYMFFFSSLKNWHFLRYNSYKANFYF